MPLDAGNSGTTTRLISGILAGQPFETLIDGDASLRSRPMKRIMDPLTLMGADIRSLSGNGCLPLRICPAKNTEIISAAMSGQILRNPLHHGVTGTAFAYRFSAINDLFREDLGKFDQPTLLKSREDIARELPRRAEFPDSFQMTTEGWFTRESTMELRQTELLFVSPAAFEYNMFRRTDERWKEEQMRDPGSLRPISFADIEPENAERFMQEYLRNEKAGTFRNTAAPDDFELCRIIDREILPAMGKRSVYELSRQNRQEIARFLQFQKKATVPSIQRCLVC